ncbi:MAG: hypothetical protein AAF657_03425 [Acidobacteriota bacterium]
MSKRRRIREKLPDILLEVGSIVLAVLLALGVNEWRETRKTRQLVQRATESVTGEMWRNRRLLEVNLPAHQQLVETLQTLAGAEDSTEQASGDDLAFNPVFLRSSAWQASMTTGAIADMSYDRVSTYSEIYNYQAACQSAMETLMAASINSFNRQPGTAEFEATANALRIMVLMEEQLLTLYQVHLDGDGSFESLLELFRRDPKASGDSTETSATSPG